jgi:hypothetical protein
MLLKRSQTRPIMLEFIERNDGGAWLRELHHAIVDAGHHCLLTNMAYHVRPLLDDGSLVKTLFGRYRTPDSLEERGEALLAQLPHGTGLKGLILHYMITNRFVKPPAFMAHMAKRGQTLNRQSVYTAFSQLLTEGLVDRVTKGMYTLSAKMLTTLHLTRPLDNAADLSETPVEIVRERLMPILHENGRTTIPLLQQYLADVGVTASRERIYIALKTLRDHKKVIQEEVKYYSAACA